MSFSFQTTKALEAVATLLRHAPRGELGKKRILAILYIADRRALQETGNPMLGGRLVAMKYGPVHSEVLDLINGVKSDDPAWADHFKLVGYQVQLKQDPGAHHLSRYEMELLTNIQQRYAGGDDWDIADATHEYQEYKDTYRPNTSTTIPLRKLVEGIGRSDDFDLIKQRAEEKKHYDSLFGE